MSAICRVSPRRWQLSHGHGARSRARSLEQRCSSSGSWVAQYDLVASSISDLGRQDPQGRIRFIMDQASPDHVYRSIRGIESLTAYVIPTWTVMARMLVHQTWKVSNKTRVDLPVRANIGCTLAALPKGHWAHGVILSDDFSAVALKDRLVDFRADSRSRNFMLDLASFAEPFSLGHPRLDLEEYSQLLKLVMPDVYSSPLKGEKVTIVNRLLEAHPVAALPLYRVIYKAQMLDETTVFIDPCRRSSKSIVAFRVAGGNGRVYSPIDRKKGTHDPHDVMGVRTASAKGGARLDPLADSSKEILFRDLLYTSMSDSAPDWHSGDIISADSILDEFLRAEELAQHDISAKTPITNRLLQSPGSWQNMIATIDSTMRGFKEGTLLANHTTYDDYSSYVNLASTGSENPFTEWDQLPMKRDVTLPAAAPSSSVAPARPSSPSIWPPRQPQIQRSRPGASPSATGVRTRQAAARPQSTMRAKTRTPAQEEAQLRRRQAMENLPIADPLLYYNILLVSPTMRFLDSRHADGVDRLLKQRRIRLARQLHPDTAEGDSEMMGKINDAFDHVESLSMRLAYNKRGMRAG